MPAQEVPRELSARHEEMVARTVAAVSEELMSEPDANIARIVEAVLNHAEPALAAITLRAFAIGAARIVVNLPEPARAGALSVVRAANDVADDLGGGVLG